jgi:hypothetical protein
MYTKAAMTNFVARWLMVAAGGWVGAGCVADVDGMAMGNGEEPAGVTQIFAVNKNPRYAAIKNAATARGMRNAYLLAGIANDETNLAMCWSEATWACQGPASPDCGGGPIIAGAADGPCSARQGGLGMFQFDAGTYNETLARYGNAVLTIDGQIGAAIDDERRDRREGARVDQQLRSEQRGAPRAMDQDGGALLQRLPAVVELLGTALPDVSRWLFRCDQRARWTRLLG